MTSRLLACPACARHLWTSERRCPFCDAALPEGFGAGPAPAPPPRGLSRPALYRRSVFAAVAGSAAVGVTGGAMLAVACGDSIAQPDDAGSYVPFEASHPMTTMYGSPCELTDDPPERCCGEVTKEILGARCYGCGGGIAYALCVGGAFTCACTCERPAGYTLIGTDADAPDCSAGIETDGESTDAPSLTDGPTDAAADTGAIVDAHEGG